MSSIPKSQEGPLRVKSTGKVQRKYWKSTGKEPQNAGRVPEKYAIRLEKYQESTKEVTGK